MRARITPREQTEFTVYRNGKRIARSRRVMFWRAGEPYMNYGGKAYPLFQKENGEYFIDDSTYRDE